MPIASVTAAAAVYSSPNDDYVPFKECSMSQAKPTVKSESEDEFLFDDVEEALAAFKRGEFLVVMDDKGRENEGDLICAASEITTEKMAWFIKHTRSVNSVRIRYVLMVVTLVVTSAFHCRENGSMN
jgi:3,4-dihydroxy 2-butanone 4-phosphate synthase